MISVSRLAFLLFFLAFAFSFLFFLKLFVCLHNLCYQFVTDDVFLVQLNEADAFYTLQYLQGLYEAGGLRGRKVNLRHVARYNHFGIHAHAGEEHLDLGSRSVLSFVEDDDGIVQCTSAHEG